MDAVKAAESGRATDRSLRRYAATTVRYDLDIVRREGRLRSSRERHGDRTPGRASRVAKTGGYVRAEAIGTAAGSIDKDVVAKWVLSGRRIEVRVLSVRGSRRRNVAVVSEHGEFDREESLDLGHAQLCDMERVAGRRCVGERFDVDVS